MEQGYIYKLTLLENTEEFKQGEVYIGKHNGIKSNYWGSGKLLQRILRKHGKSVFNREIIAKDINNNELLSYLEIYYIDFYQCNRSITNKGLNLTEGGEGIFGYKRTQEFKDAYGLKMKEKYKSGKIRPPKEKPVYQYSLEDGRFLKKFNNCVEAAKEVQIKYSSAISAVARGDGFSVANFAWSYELKDFHTVNARHKRPVLQYDLEGNFIREWKSATDVRDELGYNNSAITNCCIGINKTSYGFIWKYKNKN